jgi:hypothetical protein
MKHHLYRNSKRLYSNSGYLSEDQTPENTPILQRIAKAFTNEDYAFNFPVKYPAIDFDKPTKKMFYTTAGILAAGMVLTALILKANAPRKKTPNR